MEFKKKPIVDQIWIFGCVGSSQSPSYELRLLQKLNSSHNVPRKTEFDPVTLIDVS